jgi:multicomponent Na+:H+ antiporter subunit B
LLSLDRSGTGICGSCTRTTTVLLAFGGKGFLVFRLLPRHRRLQSQTYGAPAAALLFIFLLFLFGRGHNEPVGGFVAGLVAGAAWILDALAHDTAQARRAQHVQPQCLTGWGRLAALTGDLIGLLLGQPFLTGEWIKLELPGFGAIDLGTPLLFDLGVGWASVAGVAGAGPGSGAGRGDGGGRQGLRRRGEPRTAAGEGRALGNPLA